MAVFLLVGQQLLFKPCHSKRVLGVISAADVCRGFQPCQAVITTAPFNKQPGGRATSAAVANRQVASHNSFHFGSQLLLPLLFATTAAAGMLASAARAAAAGQSLSRAADTRCSMMRTIMGSMPACSTTVQTAGRLSTFSHSGFGRALLLLLLLLPLVLLVLWCCRGTGVLTHQLQSKPSHK
jgi:hypothetical protein